MIPLPFGITLLGIVSLLILLGFTERVFARMRLDDKTAFIFIALLVLAHFLPKISLSGYLALNLGVLIPLGVAIYLVVSTSRKERSRAFLTSFVTALALWLADKLLPIEPQAYLWEVDPLYLGGLISGLVAYLLGKSRRSAFVGAVFGILAVDLAGVLQVYLSRIHQVTVIGSGGVFSSLIIGAIIAVAIAEFIGEINERITRGPAKTTHENDLRLGEREKNGEEEVREDE